MGSFRRLSLLPLAVSALVVLNAASAAASGGPPHLPGCFKTGSGYGTCAGMVIPGGGSVTRVTHPNAGNDIYVLTGPAPLQSQTPVACGSEGSCVFNHLNWVLNGVTAVGGTCQTNQTICKVRVAPRQRAWAVVYVRQNNDPKTLWALWNPRRPDQVTLSGTVHKYGCADGTGSSEKKCEPRVEPGEGVPVTLNGYGGTKETSAAADGSYSFEVKKGHNYTLHIPGGTRVAKPAKHSVSAKGPVGNLDFTVCRPPKHYSGKRLSCDLVTVSGSVVDIASKPFELAGVTDGTGVGLVDGTGRYSLVVPRGHVTLTAYQDYARVGTQYPDTAQRSVNATKEENSVPRMTIRPVAVMSSVGEDSLLVNVLGLPANTSTSDTFDVARTAEVADQICNFKTSAYLMANEVRVGSAVIRPKAPFTSFCAGDYTGTVTDAHGHTVTTTKFTIP